MPKIPMADADPDYEPFVMSIQKLHSKQEVAMVKVDYVDPIGDIAILGSLDDQASYEEVEQYERFIEDVEFVVLDLEGPPEYEEIDWDNLQKTKVYFRDVNGKWLSGKTFTGRTSAFSTGPRRLDIEMDNKRATITAGTSGSPIFNESGVAIGVLNMEIVVAGNPNHTGHAISLPDCLPVWLFDFLRKNGTDKK